MIRQTHSSDKTAGQKRAGAWNSLAAAAMLLLAAGILVQPALVFDGLLAGLRTACMRVVPAVFPMMVVSAVVMDSPLAGWLGLPLAPYTRALGIRDRSAATVLFLGLLGGFAVLAQGVDQLYRSRRLDREQAQLLLCAGMNAGPSFILLSVGYDMFGSLGLGGLLLAALVLANLCSALLLRFFDGRRPPAVGRMPQAIQQGGPRKGAFGAALQRSASACVTLCGTIAFFALVSALVQWVLPPKAALGCAAVLEVTTGVLAAAESGSPYRVYLALGVLCWTGVSIQQQARALLPAEIGLRRFYLSRLFALPLSLALYAAGVRLFPGAVAAGSFVLRGSRFSWGIWASFFLMVAAFLYECTPKALYGQPKREYNG